MFSAASRPTAALTFEASVDVHLDILFDHTTAAAYRCKLTSDGTAQPCWNNMPVVDPVTITQDVAKELVEWFWTTLAIWTGSQRFQHRFAVGFPDCAHDAAMLGLILANKTAHFPCNVPAIQEPMSLSKFSLPHPFESFIPVA